MYDFLKVQKKWDNKLQRNVYTPSYVLRSNIRDLLVRGGKFYAIFNYNTNLWEMDDSKAVALIDQQVEQWVKENDKTAIVDDPEHAPIIQHLSDTSNKLIIAWHNFCERDYRPEWDMKRELNQKVIFSNQDAKREDYATIKLDYPLQESPTPNYDRLCEVLYLPSEQEKWEWFVGCILSGDQRKIQKMLIFYGEPGSGKSTILEKVITNGIFNGMDNGYVTSFEANNLTGNDSFGTDFLAKSAVLATDNEAEMQLITKKAMLNKIISHETITVNPKFGKRFSLAPGCVLIAASNEPVQMSPTSGMNRRIIDIRPTGNRLDSNEYDKCVEGLQFERSGMAWKCLQTYKRLRRHYYDHYIAEDMLSRTSPFQNYVQENYFELKDGISLAAAYKLYTDYAAESNFKNILPRYKFRDTLKLYFEKYENMKFSGFKPEKIGIKPLEPAAIGNKSVESWIDLKEQPSILDKLYADCPAQYEQDDPEHPLKYSWVNCHTKLKDLDTHRIHYLKGPVVLIFLDFDMRDKNGNKDLAANIEMASKFPPTYAEVSKSGGGLHLYYIYTGGEPDKLSRTYCDNVEVKVMTGGQSIRRKLTLCNDIPVAEIDSGLPLKEEKGVGDVIDWEGFKNERILRSMIVNALQKKHHGHTKPEVDYIYKALDEAYKSGSTYDVRDLENDVFGFAVNSTNKAQYCMSLVDQMHFCSKDIEEKENAETEDYSKAPIIFLDVEISPSWQQAHDAGVEMPDYIPHDTPALFLINWKYQGDGKPVTRMLNPTPEEVEKLFKFRIIGFNNRAYDNHMLYARSQGYSSEELYVLSGKLINENKEIERKARFGQAYNLSYTDILDFAATKEGLKKREIALGIRHLEWDKPWYWPVPVKDWPKFAEYCDNDVISSEIVFNYLKPDWDARQMLSKMSGLTVNDTTNQHTISILTSGIKDPQSQYIYTELNKMKWPDGSLIFPGYEFSETPFPKEKYIEGTKLVKRHSFYRGEDPGEGGHKVGYPGMYSKVVLLDVASMHPHSAIRLKVFGPVITKRFENLVEARIAIKHIKEIGDDAYNNAISRMNAVKDGAGDVIVEMLKGLEGDALRTMCVSIAYALKIAINSVYGLTSAKFQNKLKDPKNIDNIVAKYGALFMINLKHELWDRGFKVAHVSTDSIKIPDATNEIIDFVMDYGKKYGFTFEFEAAYDKLCIVDHVNYIAHHYSSEECKKLFNGFVPEDNEKAERPKNQHLRGWTVTGDTFAEPSVLKNLFTHEKVEFQDLCETISVNKGALHLIFNEGCENEVDNFIGRIGRFTPMASHGGKLYSVNAEGKRNAAQGTKGYEWLESNYVESAKLEDYINHDYFKDKINETVNLINEFGDFNTFSETDDFVLDMNPPESAS